MLRPETAKPSLPKGKLTPAGGLGDVGTGQYVTCVTIPAELVTVAVPQGTATLA
jgi:hypothetical protein